MNRQGINCKQFPKKKWSFVLNDYHLALQHLKGMLLELSGLRFLENHFRTITIPHSRAVLILGQAQNSTAQQEPIVTHTTLQKSE